MIRRIMGIVLSAALLTGLFPARFALADDEDLASDTIITAQCKRIKDDDTYFEISLDVNKQDPEIHGVTMALQYDPTLLLPVTWSGADIDMTHASSLAQAPTLPTLTHQKWLSKLAKTYDDTGSRQNYLLLSTEYDSSNDSVNAKRDTGQTLIVRFKYASDTAKQYIIDNWNDDWRSNNIITIAPDDVAQNAYLKYPVSVYYADGTMKAYAQTPPAELDSSEQLAAADFDVKLTEGESAQSEGGLTLNDVSAVLFFDWDDAFMGAITLARGEDGRETINDFVNATFVHPALRANTSYESKARADNYRGEYPYNEPDKGGGGDPVSDGALYPLTNKLDYVFYGKTVDGVYPYVSGWKKVDPNTMSDDWTALSAGEEPGEACDFSQINDSVIYVKAYYTPGDGLNHTNTTATNGSLNVYYTFTESTVKSLDKATAKAGTYAISYKYMRINQYGFGVTKVKEPAVRMYMTPDASSSTILMKVNVENADTIDVELTPTKGIQSVDYQLVNTDGYDILGAQTISDVGQSQAEGMGGFITEGTWNKFADALMKNANGDTSEWTKIDYIAANDANIRADEDGGTFATSKKFTTPKKTLANCGTAAVQAGYETVTYYQVQYYLLNSTLLDPAQAESQCKALYSWCR